MSGTAPPQALVLTTAHEQGARPTALRVAEDLIRGFPDGAGLDVKLHVENGHLSLKVEMGLADGEG